MRIVKEAICVGALLVAVTPVDAGPDFIEGMCSGGSAGSFPGTACGVTGVGNLSTITGGTSMPFGPGLLDLEDMYIIRITDASIFSASTLDALTTFDTQLWLFRVDEFDPLLDGVGLLANNDISAMETASMLGPMSTDGTVVITEGFYYLAISGGAGAGFPGRFPVAAGAAMFDFMTPTDIVGPLDPFAIIDDWSGDGAVGTYVIRFEGVSFIPAPGAFWVLALLAVNTRRRRRATP